MTYPKTRAEIQTDAMTLHGMLQGMLQGLEILQGEVPDGSPLLYSDLFNAEYRGTAGSRACRCTGQPKCTKPRRIWWWR